MLLHGNAEILHAGELFLQLRQLVIMGGEQRFRPQLSGVSHIFQHRPGNAHAVIGGGTPSDFIQHQQAIGGSVAQDIRHFGHLHHKGRLSRRQIVRGTDTGINPVHNADFRGRGRHKTADLRHEDNQGNLAHIGGFTRHIGAGNNGYSVLVHVQIHIIGHKGRAVQQGFHHRMTAVL